MNNLKLVFSSYSYVILGIVVFVSMFVPISLLSEFMFVEPYLVLHVTEYSAFGFTLVIMVSIISAIVIPMNVYRIKRLQKGTSKIGGSMIGTIIGASAGICGCGPIGFSIISIFGTVAGTTTAFLTEYEIPIRLGSIGLLCIVYYTTSRSISMECKVN